MSRHTAAIIVIMSLMSPAFCQLSDSALESIRKELIGSTAFPAPQGVEAFVLVNNTGGLLFGSPDNSAYQKVETPSILVYPGSVPEAHGSLSGCQCRATSKPWYCTKTLIKGEMTIVSETKAHPREETVCYEACKTGMVDGQEIKDGALLVYGDLEGCNRVFDAAGTELHVLVKKTKEKVNGVGELLRSSACPLANTTCRMPTGELFVKTELTTVKDKCTIDISAPLDCGIAVSDRELTLRCPGYTVGLDGGWYRTTACSGESMFLLTTHQSLILAVSPSEKDRLCRKAKDFCEKMFASRLTTHPDIGDHLPAQILSVMEKSTTSTTEALRSIRGMLTGLGNQLFSYIGENSQSTRPSLVVRVPNGEKVLLKFYPGSVLMMELTKVEALGIFDNRQKFGRWPVKYYLNGTEKVGFLDLETNVVYSETMLGSVPETALLRVNDTHSCSLISGCSQFYPVLDSLVDPMSIRTDTSSRLYSYFGYEIAQLRQETYDLMAQINEDTREITVVERSSSGHSSARIVRIGLWTILKEAPWYVQAAAAAGAALSVSAVLSYVWIGVRAAYMWKKGLSALRVPSSAARGMQERIRLHHYS